MGSLDGGGGGHYLYTCGERLRGRSYGGKQGDDVWVLVSLRGLSPLRQNIWFRVMKQVVLATGTLERSKF